ncbi:sigma-54-dependent transcriptional regulator [Candidatus Methylacidithermus pantelleriae]|nr:sigma-54 dependent transcriptional regulator [Candidatus Methylacidithermus pantelleriae]
MSKTQAGSRGGKKPTLPEIGSSQTGEPEPDRILIVDDEKDVHYAFERLLEPEGWRVLRAESGKEALAVVSQQPVDVVVMDIRMAGQNGLETLREIRRRDPSSVVIMMTAYGTAQTAIEAMKLGAFDYILKPFELEGLKALLERARLAARHRKELPHTEGTPVPSSESLEFLVGSSFAMQRVYKLIGQVAPTSATVLITGESGTGKELIARAIHQHSLRAGKPFVAMNCAAIPDNLLESELFGHERGAFTGAMTQRIGKFEEADGGTLFLDEIGDMPLTTQTKILRVLQEGEFSRVGSNVPIRVDVRLIAATNKDLARAVQKREFREDLYYRLNVVRIHVPPLRERLPDLPELVQHFLRKHRKSRPGGGSLRVSEEAWQLLYSYSWPGNVRELENAIQRALVFATGSSIEPADLPEEIRSCRVAPASMGRTEEVEKAAEILLDWALGCGGEGWWQVLEELFQSKWGERKTHREGEWKGFRGEGKAKG